MVERTPGEELDGDISIISEMAVIPPTSCSVAHFGDSFSEVAFQKQFSS